MATGVSRGGEIALKLIPTYLQTRYINHLLTTYLLDTDYLHALYIPNKLHCLYYSLQILILVGLQYHLLRISPNFAVFRRVSLYFGVFRRLSACFAVFRRLLGVFTDPVSGC